MRTDTYNKIESTNSSFLNQLSQNRPFLMGGAIISIMLFHQAWISVPPFNAFHIWGHYGVDVFMFLSGIGLAFSLNRNSLMTFYKRRILRMLPICILCGVCKYCIYSIWEDCFHDIKNISFLTLLGLDLWFIQTISVFYLLTPFLYELLKKNTYLVLLGGYMLCFATSFFFPDIHNNITGSINRLPAFLVGMAFVINRWDINTRYFLYSLFFLLLASFSTILDTKNYFHWGNDLWMYPILSLGLPSLIYIIEILKDNFCRIGDKLLINVGNHSLELYLWHEFVFGCVWLTLNYRINNYLLLSLAFFISFMLAYFCRFLINKIFDS